MNTDAIETTLLEVEPHVSHEKVCEAITKIDALVAFALDARRKLADRAIAWIEANKQDIEIGTVRYYVGHPPRTTCVDVRGTVEAALLATGGDLDRFATLLVAQPFKPGACARELGPEDVARLFVTEHKAKLIDGVSRKQLSRVDTRFVEQYAGQPEGASDAT